MRLLVLIINCTWLHKPDWLKAGANGPTFFIQHLLKMLEGVGWNVGWADFPFERIIQHFIPNIRWAFIPSENFLRKLENLTFDYSKWRQKIKCWMKNHLKRIQHIILVLDERKRWMKNLIWIKFHPTPFNMIFFFFLRNVGWNWCSQTVEHFHPTQCWMKMLDRLLRPLRPRQTGPTFYPTCWMRCWTNVGWMLDVKKNRLAITIRPFSSSICVHSFSYFFHIRLETRWRITCFGQLFYLS